MFPWLKDSGANENINRSNIQNSPDYDGALKKGNNTNEKNIMRQVVNTQILSNQGQTGSYDTSKEYNPFYDNKFKDNQVNFLIRKENHRKEGVFLDPATHQKHERIKGDYVDFVRDAMKIDRSEFNKKRYRKPEEVAFIFL